MSLSFEEFARRRVLKPGLVKLPDGVVHVANLNSNERDLFETQWLSYKGDADSNVGFRAFCCTWLLCDESNVRFIDPGEESEPSAEIIEGLEQVSDLPAVIVSRVFDIASKVNGITGADIEELEKNYGATDDDDGSCDNQPQPEQVASIG